MFDESKFIAEIKALANKSRKAQQARSNESATIHLVVLPFIKALGYDIFNDEDVAPEFVADVVGTKHNEKVDYALKIDGQPVIIIEAKSTSSSLGSAQHSQLYRYFSTLHRVKLAILTNGKEACFYSDLQYTNVMDDEPFLKLDFQDNNDDNFDFLKSIHRNNFSVDDIIAHAKSKKYYNEVKDFLQQNLSNPSEDFVYFVGKAVKDGQRPRKSEMPSFESAIRKAFNEISKSEGNATALKSNLSASTIQPFNNQVNSVESISEAKKPAASYEWILNFYSDFKKYLDDSTSDLKISKPTSYGTQILRSWGGFYLQTQVSTRKIVVCFYVYNKENKIFMGRSAAVLNNQKSYIENKIDASLDWKMTDKGISIKLAKDADASETDPQTREAQFRWLKEKSELFYDVFFELTKDINP